MIRSTGDFVRVCHEVTEQLEELSTSDLQTLNQTLMHTHSHVVQEMNARLRRKLGEDPDA